MKTVKINLRKVVDNSYDIVIDKNIIDKLPKLLNKKKIANRYILITDNTVKKKNGSKLLESFRKFGLKTYLLSLKPGEESKTREVKAKLEDKILQLGCGRDTAIIALGGGVVGDIAGFVAATLHRGIPFIQVPTTLLAQIDSSIGGKTAVNHPLGKNLIGAFHQPKLVVIDINTLKTLPKKEIRNGLIEVIKHALILDSEFFVFLEENIDRILKLDDKILKETIKKSCEIKKGVVEVDEKEKDFRKILNFGHTIGHALELGSNHKLTHGEAVTLGIIAETKISNELGFLNSGGFNRITAMIKKIELPTKIPKNISVNQVIKNTKLDKKSVKGIPQFTLLKKIGKAELDSKVPNRIISKVLSEMK